MRQKKSAPEWRANRRAHTQIHPWIGITAPSSPVDKSLLKKNLLSLSRWGFPLQIDDAVYGKHRYLGGTDDKRAAGLLRLFRDPHVNVVWCARGGYGLTRILPTLEREKKLLRAGKKLLVGFSDVTALHALYDKLGLPSVHAPMPGTTSWKKVSASCRVVVQKILCGGFEYGRDSHSLRWKTGFFPGSLRREARGVVKGGNLTLVHSLVGTPWQLDLRGSLLFLEDCAENPYRVDRMLTQLVQSGALRGVRGILLGDFSADVVYSHPSEKKYWKEMFQEILLPLGVPVLHCLPVGHGIQNEPLPLGIRARIRKDGKLEYLEGLSYSGV